VTKEKVTEFINTHFHQRMFFISDLNYLAEFKENSSLFRLIIQTFI